MSMLLSFLRNPFFLTVFFSWLVAGIIKYFILKIQKKKPVFVDELMRTGGMPSSHSASVMALTTTIFFLEGFSTLFFITLVFSIIIIRDSYGVRWSVGEQAKIINKLLRHDKMHKKVRVILGHTPSQVNAGIVLGIIVTIIIHFLLR